MDQNNMYQNMGYDPYASYQNNNGSFNAIQNNNQAKTQSGSEYKPLSVGAYLGYMLLFLIPIVGIIFMIVFAVNKSNKGRQNLAIASLLYIVVMLPVAILFLVMFMSLGILIYNQAHGVVAPPTPSGYYYDNGNNNPADALEKLTIDSYNSALKYYIGDNKSSYEARTLIGQVNSLNISSDKTKIRINNGEYTLSPSTDEIEIGKRYKITIDEYDSKGYISLISITAIDSSSTPSTNTPAPINTTPTDDDYGDDDEDDGDDLVDWLNSSYTKYVGNDKTSKEVNDLIDFINDYNYDDPDDETNVFLKINDGDYTHKPSKLLIEPYKTYTITIDKYDSYGFVTHMSVKAN